MSHPAAPVIRLPTYSVVIPNYNHAHYLESALEGHLTQRVPPREIIVVDDASTDENCALVERVSDKHSHVRLIRFPRNSGVNAAINRGLREACGGYVCVSAADDALTWTMNLNVGAVSAGCDALDQYLVIDPSKPGSRYQPFDTQHNYVSDIDNLFPAFLCSPMLRSLTNLGPSMRVWSRIWMLSRPTTRL